MSLANGREYIAIPGPSVMPDRVLAAMHRPAPNIYDRELENLTESLVSDLADVAGTTGKVAMYISNGHGIWEAALANIVEAGDRVLVLNTGRFAEGWAAVAHAREIEVEMLDFGVRNTIDFAKVSEVLNDDTERTIKAVLAVHVDTASSVRNDIGALRRAIDEAGHPALLAVDCMASLGCEVYEMDALGVDLTTAGSQKGLMTPPGMAFLWLSDKALTERSRLARVTQYWDCLPRIEPLEYYQYFCGTAPTHHLFGLREALNMIKEEGTNAVWNRHAKLAKALWAACDRWGQEGPMELNIEEPSNRSHAVTALRIGSPHGTALRDWLTENAGVTLGIGLGMAPPGDPAAHGFFRVGHMGHVNAHMVMGVIGSMDAALKALGIPHGSGAIEAASEAIAL